MKFLQNTFIACLALVLTLWACRKEDNLTTDSASKLAFSSDTLRFDTVFTSIGSATRAVRIINPNNQRIRISSIKLAGKTQAVFNLNIDGISGRAFSNVEIAAKDSIWVFAEVTINPNAPLSSSPFVIAEDLEFETNGNKQRVVLEAFGQNANYIPNRWAGGKQAVLNCGGGEVVWNDPKPYVVYGVLGISNGTLKLPAGCKVYVHGGLARPNDSTLYRDGILFVLGDGRLVADGTLDKPVIIQGDRLEKEFEDLPDQWAGIILGEQSRGNSLKFTTIRNSRVGIRVDSAANLQLQNCKIYNTAASGLQTRAGNVVAINTLIHSNGGNAAQVDFGGNFTFQYCTFSGLGSSSPALSANNYWCYEATSLGQCLKAKSNPLSMNVSNCIIFGSKEDQVELFDATTNINTDFNTTFTNCIVRVKDLLKPTSFPNFLTDNCKSCINAPVTAKLFRKPNSGDYHLDTLSIAEQKALPINGINLDLDNKVRDTQKPDLGCYEFVPK
jgi:Right handed beta helix region